MKDLEIAPTITAEAFREKMADDTSLVVIDTLIRDRYDAVHTKGAGQACVFEVTFL